MSSLFDKILSYARSHPLQNVDANIGTADGTRRVEREDYRGFCLCVHEAHGLMMLHCTRKKNKPPHHQLAGGHVDDPEFDAAAKLSNDEHTQLYLAARMGVARELFEETGIDVRGALHRFGPMVLRKDDNKQLPNHFKHRLFFVLPVTDEDYLTKVEPPEDLTVRVVPPMGDAGKNLMLKLSVEHSGFRFERDPHKAIEMLELHSGGKVSEAIKKALNVAEGGN